MAATITSLEHIGRGQWRAQASSDLGGSPTLYYYYRGALLRATADTELSFRAFDGEVPYLEVFDDADARPKQRDHPGRLSIHWHHDGAAARFDIEEQIGGVWTNVSRIANDGRRHYTWVSGWLDDLSAHTYRVRAVDGRRNAVTVATLSSTVVRHPTVPRTNLTRNNDGSLTITEA